MQNDAQGRRLRLIRLTRGLSRLANRQVAVSRSTEVPGDIARVSISASGSSFVDPVHVLLTAKGKNDLNALARVADRLKLRQPITISGTALGNEHKSL